MNAAKNGGKNGKASGVSDASAASLDQVREILFGEQARDVAQQLSQLQKRLDKQLNALQTDMTKRFEAAGKANVARVEALREALDREADKRADANKDLSVDLERSSSELEAKLEDADQRLRASLTELDHQLAKSRESLGSEIKSLATSSNQALSSATADLQDRKANREDLAAMFAEIAERLSSGPRKKG